jgi:DNA-binding CsgD family transcriptional regulator
MISLESRLTGVIAEKDSQLRVISCNDVFLELAGVKSRDEVIGRTDYDFCWTEYASLYAVHEMDALLGNNYSAMIASKDYTGRTAISLHTKIGKKNNEGTIDGIICRAVEIINPHWSELAVQLAKNSPLDQYCYYLGKTTPFQLTSKQNEILFYLVRGKAAKVIAAITGTSTRTVEHHISHIKNKMNCRTQSELISKAITHGFLAMLPRDTVENLVKKIKQ